MLDTNLDRIASLVLEAADEYLGHYPWDRTNPVTRGRVAAEALQALMAAKGDAMDREGIDDLIHRALESSESQRLTAVES